MIMSGQILGTIQAVGSILDVLSTGELGPEPAAHGVLLFRERLDELADDQGTVLYHAEVTIGGGEVSTSFLCDWSGQFAVVAQRLQIRAVAESTRIEDMGYDTYSARRYRHGAIVGFGGWHASKPLTLTLRDVYLVSTNPATVIEVPRFATRFRPRFGNNHGTFTEIAADPADLVDVGLVSVGLTPPACQPAFVSTSQRLTEAILRDGIDVAGVGYLVIAAASGAALMQMTPVFELAL